MARPRAPGTPPRSEKRRESDRLYYLKNKEKRNKSDKVYRLENKEKINERQRKHYQTNKEEINAQRRGAYSGSKRQEDVKRYRLKNIKKAREEYRKWYLANREKREEYMRQWRAANPDRVKAAQERRLSKPFNRVCAGIRVGIYECLKKGKNGRSWTLIVGYGPEELRAHLERQFTKGMSWENYGKFGWHIDHRVPLASFDFGENPDEVVKSAWALTNLQPLWATDNHQKHAKRLYLL